jgi:hypothetical protein
MDTMKEWSRRRTNGDVVNKGSFNSIKVVKIQEKVIFNSIKGSFKFNQGFGSGSVSGSVLDPYSMGPLDPDPDL